MGISLPIIIYTVVQKVSRKQLTFVMLCKKNTGILYMDRSLDGNSLNSFFEPRLFTFLRFSIKILSSTLILPISHVGNFVAVLLQVYLGNLYAKSYRNITRFDVGVAKIKRCKLFAPRTLYSKVVRH